MRLADLEPHFNPPGSPVAASSLRFLCPKCFHVNGGAAGTHLIRVVNHGTEAHKSGPSWVFRGSSADDFTLDWAPGSEGRSSIQIIGGCEAHFNIHNGTIVKANGPDGKLSW